MFSALIGGIGIYMILLGFSFFAGLFSDFNLMNAIGCLVFLVLGAYFAYVSYLVIWRFSTRSINHFSFLLAILLFSISNDLLSAIKYESGINPVYYIKIIRVAMPLFLSGAAYLVLSKCLSLLIENKNNPNQKIQTNLDSTTSR
jgi:hypothetical protein